MILVYDKKIVQNYVPAKPGIYKIYWYKKGIPQTIKRIAGIDESGLLYIGKTDGTLKDRLNQFRLNAFKGSSNHSGALKYKKYSVLNILIKPDEIFAVWEVVTNESPLDREKRELKIYAEKFGEVPPLNG